MDGIGGGVPPEKMTGKAVGVGGVVSCTRLDNTEQISRPDPYVSINYGGNMSTTHGPVFPETFVYPEIEGLTELNVHAWNKDSSYDFIGSGRISLAKALFQGFDDDIWPLESEPGRNGGVVRIIMNYTNGNKPPKDSADKPSDGYAPSAPPYVASPAPSYRIYPPNGVSHQAPYRPQTTSYPLSPYPPYESIHHPGCGDEMGRNAFVFVREITESERKEKGKELRSKKIGNERL
ncbi:hypothetical protein M8C21_010838, partial [Ambrosia artemisiifolia]